MFLQYYCIVLLGAPIPMATGENIEPTAEAKQAFPCSGGMCGCSFEHCWSSCCCHTLAERLDWARKNNVRPPKAAIEHGIRVGLDVSYWCEPRNETKSKQSPAEDAGQCRECCQTEKAKAAPKDEVLRESNGVVILKAMSCRGITFAWSTILAAPLPNAISISPQQVIAQAQDAEFRFDFPEAPEPPTPPPRRAFASY